MISKGTKNIVTTCYDSFKKNGCKWFLLCNKVAGYCTPQNQTMMSISHVNTTKTYYDDNYSYAHAHSKKRSSSSSSLPSYYYSQEHLAEQYGETDIENALYKELGIKPICTIPCYCDMQFSKKEFLTSIQYPYHSFSRKIKTLADSIQQEAKNI